MRTTIPIAERVEKGGHGHEGHYHDLLADLGKEQVMADIQGWINGHQGSSIRPDRHSGGQRGGQAKGRDHVHERGQ